MKPADYWYPWNPERFRRDTRGLSLAARGAYRELIDEYMSSGRPIPANAKKIAAICGCTVEEWLEISGEVLPFFEPIDDLGGPVDNLEDKTGVIQLRNKRCENVLFSQLEAAEKRSFRARKGGLARQRKLRETKQKELKLNAKQTTKPKLQAVDNSAKISYRREDKNLSSDVEGYKPSARTREGQQQQESGFNSNGLSEESEENPFLEPIADTTKPAENQAVQENTRHDVVDPLRKPLAASVAEIMGVPELDHDGLAVCERWVAKGFDVELDILPTLRDHADQAPPATLKVFTKTIQAASYRRTGQAERARATEAEGAALERSRKRWAACLALWEKTGKWKDAGPSPESSSCLAPPDLLRELRARLAQTDDDEKRRHRPAS